MVRNDATITFEVLGIGELRIRSGRVAASDPLVCPKPAPFTVAVPHGDHVVELAIAKFPNGDERVAFARLRLDDSQGVVTWELARQEGQNLADLTGRDQFFGYGVDTGTGCFMDAEAGALLEALMDDKPDTFEHIMDAMEATYKHTRSWLDFRPQAQSPLNIMCFTSGFGDGAYPSFFGLGLEGNPVSLITDFLALG